MPIKLKIDRELLYFFENTFTIFSISISIFSGCPSIPSIAIISFFKTSLQISTNVVSKLNSNFSNPIFLAVSSEIFSNMKSAIKFVTLHYLPIKTFCNASVIGGKIIFFNVRVTD